MSGALAVAHGCPTDLLDSLLRPELPPPFRVVEGPIETTVVEIDTHFFLFLDPNPLI
jgi:hypothetical protein